MAAQILIVDDNTANRYMLETLLKGHGFEVVSAENGRDALEKARLIPPDLIITDILMPVMDGYALCREWKSDDTLKHIPFVFYTATYTESKDEAFALSLGADEFIFKPQEPDHFMDMIKRVLGKNHAARQVASNPLGEEMEFFRQHNEVLFSKLEKKMSDLEIANQELRILDERYRLSFENVTDVICTVDTDLIISDMSPSIQKLLGYKPHDLIGQSLPDLGQLFTPESFKELRAEIRTTLKGKTNPATVHQFITKDKILKHVELSKSPMIRDGEVVGAICVARDITERKQAEEHLQETLDRLRKAAETTIQVMVSTVEARDPYTAGHQLRVADLARAVAIEMGLPQEKIDGIFMAGSIHDIGKLAVPAEILTKPGRLTEVEFAMIQEHSEKGYEILKGIESDWPLAEIVHQHHERMDGSGYPRNLKGDAILIEARILAVADVVESMASHRPYRSSMGIDAALDEIAQNKGTLYDLEVADACLRLFHEKKYRFE